MLHFCPPRPGRSGRPRSDPSGSVPAADAALTPAAYLRLRRCAAGLSIAAVAERIAPRIADRSGARALVALLETDGARARYAATLDRLAGAIPFHPAIYRQLADDPADRHPRICRACGWSEADRGSDPVDGPARAWATPACCTTCADEAGAELPR